MARRNEKYSKEMKEQTAAFILETGKSATKTAKEMGIDVNTVCRWVRDYRKEHNMPSYAEEQGIHKRPVLDAELRARNKQLERQLKEKEAEIKSLQKQLKESQEDTEILKKPAHLYATPRMKYEAIKEHRNEFSVERMCRVLGLHAPNYYNGRSRKKVVQGGGSKN